MSDQAATSALEDEVERALAQLQEVAAEPGPAFPPSEPASEPPAAPTPAAAPEPPRQPVVPLRDRAHAIVSRGLDDDVSRFLATAERMLTRIRNEMADAESAYAVDRAKLADGFRRQIIELENAAADSLSRLETNHRENMGKRKRMLDALMAMRGD